MPRMLRRGLEVVEVFVKPELLQAEANLRLDKVVGHGLSEGGPDFLFEEVVQPVAASSSPSRVANKVG